MEKLKEKNNFSHFARRERRKKRDKKQIVQGAGHTDGAIMQRFVASADKKLKYPMYLLNINTK